MFDELLHTPFPKEIFASPDPEPDPPPPNDPNGDPEDEPDDPDQ